MIQSINRDAFSVLQMILISMLLAAGCSQPTSAPAKIGEAAPEKVEVKAPETAPAKAVVDLSTPESAMLSIEEAYRNNDLEAVLKCKDFDVEARLMMDKLDLAEELKNDEEILTQLKETLELGFRAEHQKNGFPNFNGATSTFSDKTPYRGKDDVIQMKETVKFPDGQTATSTVHVAKTEDGWKFVMIPDAN